MCDIAPTFRDVLEPVGPLAPSIYWRRRCLALGLAVLVLAGFVWTLGALVAAGDDPVLADPETAALGAPFPEPGTPASGGAALPAGAAPSVPGAGAPAAGGAPGAPGDPGTAFVAPPGGDGFRSLLPDGTAPGALPPGVPPAAAGALPTPAGAAAPVPSAPVPSAPVPSTPVPTDPAPVARAAPAPGPCADGDLRVTARTDSPRYEAGQKPVFSLVVTNASAVPCVRDLDAAKQAVAVVRTPGDGLWGSNDCSPGDTDDVRTLAPGQEAVFSLRWSGRTSAPGCGGARTVVPPGDYQLLARLDTIVSEPARFTLAG